MKDSGLPRCPFCGWPAERKHDPFCGGYYIRCLGCGARTELMNLPHYAEERWKRRDGLGMGRS